jgi:hypothetical protein
MLIMERPDEVNAALVAVLDQALAGAQGTGVQGRGPS